MSREQQKASSELLLQQDGGVPEAAASLCYTA